MSRATVTATSVLCRYFASRGEKTPQVQAESFIPRIMMHRDGSWRSDDLVDTATAILASAAIDVDDLVENYLEITLSIEPLHQYDRRAGAQVFGMAFPSTREIVICERAEAYQPLYRTCVAHELGHILLHHAEAQERVLAYAPFANARPPEECEADEFMTHLLSPKSVILLACSLAAHQSGLHLAEVLGRANSKRGRWQWQHGILPCMVDRLCLSRHLLSIRMRELGIFTNETVDFHRTYAAPNRWRRAHTPDLCFLDKSARLDDFLKQADPL